MYIFNLILQNYWSKIFLKIAALIYTGNHMSFKIIGQIKIHVTNKYQHIPPTYRLNNIVDCVVAVKFLIFFKSAK